MKSIVIHAPKDLRIEEHAEEQPGPGQVAVRLATGGVCGTDLHYYHHGGFGAVRLKQPMILGHEVSGHVQALGTGVEDLAIGDLVAVSPSRPCGSCTYCAEGLPNHCLNMRFYGSAMPFPHIQGAFRQVLVADATQCVRADGLTAGEAAMAEPLSVCLHAARRAGELLGKRVLVTGCGPIGLLCIAVARRAGAAEIVATDLSANALTFGESLGADRVLNVSDDPDGLTPYGIDKGSFDILFECTGNEHALAGAINVMRPRGIVMQLGLGGDMNVPVQALTAKELSLSGSFRFHEEFPLAVAMMQKRLVDVAPLITHTVPLAEAENAFHIASDRAQAIKAQIAFD